MHDLVVRNGLVVDGSGRPSAEADVAIEVREVILQMSVYGGVPVALDGMRIFEAVLAERPGETDQPAEADTSEP